MCKEIKPKKKKKKRKKCRVIVVLILGQCWVDVILLHTAIIIAIILVQVEEIKFFSRSRLEKWHCFLITRSVCSGWI